MIRAAVQRWWATPAVRRRVGLILAGIALVIGVFGLLTGRYGLIVAAIILLGLAAASGPARIRR